MNIQSYQYTPVGFRSPLYEGSKAEAVADDLITRYWQIATTDPKGEANTWEFRRKLINRAMDLFRFFPEWLQAQEDNPKLTPHMRAFLEDTLSFINTGRRRMGIVPRAYCLQTERELATTPKYRSGRSAPKLKMMLNVDGKDYMYHWLKHDNGFEDLLATVNVIFGELTLVAGSSR
ncbi:virion structural protein [Klebsiella phage vB_KpM_FBKp24]|uniref:Putative virion structural protein n=1 Tax=Klebsiella phage vB_KpM_FBKp24 TaxID=2801834 RepID=A0A7U0GBL7_9CAUD|nr:hypothetical protein [Klebsiella pneumoniae]YP_010298653.1 virion structural protein [Klebsiella phage vB_KpM_FBKp24]QQV92168.1 putative virion structural protein [Klebsiella phage vB_KpM_FBKp24]